jgi:hypothetical protein
VLLWTEESHRGKADSGVRRKTGLNSTKPWRVNLAGNLAAPRNGATTRGTFPTINVQLMVIGPVLSTTVRLFAPSAQSGNFLLAAETPAKLNFYEALGRTKASARW